jgi:hypothetical protein
MFEPSVKLCFIYDELEAKMAMEVMALLPLVLLLMHSMNELSR